MHSVTRVLVADEYPQIRSCLVRLLETQDDMKVAATATNGAEALALAEALAPDVVVMDVKLPLVSGTEACRRILDTLPDTRILMICSDSLKPLIEESLANGASGYLAKECSLAQVPTAIREILAGRTYLCLVSQHALQSSASGEGI